MTPKRAALLSSGPPLSLKVLYCLHRLGIETDVIDLGAPSIAKYSRYRRRYARVQLEGLREPVEEAGRLLHRYAEGNGIEALVAGDIQSSGLLHALAERLHPLLLFPTSSSSTLEMLDDKWRFQQFMVAHGIPCPRSALLQEPSDVDRLTLRLPWVIKPLRTESGHGIVHAESIEAVRRYLQSGSRYARLPLVAQEFAPGQDADLSILAKEGRVAAHVLQMRHGECTLRFAANDEVLEIGKRIAAAANYTGVANIDVRIDHESGRVLVLECNPRFWSTLQASLWRGFNFVEAGLALAAGAPLKAEAPVGGAYHLHGCLLKGILWNPAYWRDIPLYNLRGLLQALSDPMPFIRARSPRSRRARARVASSG